VPYIAGSLARAGNKASAVIHTNADYGTIFRSARKPFVVSVHHDVFDEDYRKHTNIAQQSYHFGLLKKRIGQAFDAADHVIAVSYNTRSSIERTFGRGGIEVIHNGVDTDFFKPKEVSVPQQFRDKLKLLFVGRLSKRKGADLLPQIAARCGSDVVLFHTGSPADKRQFPSKKMIPLGTLPRDRLPDIYNMSDIFVFPSRLEGFGYAVAEAMACAKPVVCTNGSSLPELIVDGAGGYLCEQDKTDDFVEKIRRLGSDGHLRQTMGEFNRKRIVEEFTLAKMAERYSRMYRAATSASTNQAD
jgi:glycosyltransferase involved in cell wall biosynthesis